MGVRRFWFGLVEKKFIFDGSKKKKILHAKKSDDKAIPFLRFDEGNEALILLFFRLSKCFHLLCCLLRVGERVFDRSVKSYEIRVTCNFGENSIFFSIVLGSSLSLFNRNVFCFQSS